MFIDSTLLLGENRLIIFILLALILLVVLLYVHYKYVRTYNVYRSTALLHSI